MLDRFTLLLITLSCVISAFFVGLYFGRSLDTQTIADMKKNLQVSLDIRGNTIKTERSDAAIKVIVNGMVMSGSGEIKIGK